MLLLHAADPEVIFGFAAARIIVVDPDRIVVAFAPVLSLLQSASVPPLLMLLLLLLIDPLLLLLLSMLL